MNPRQFVIEGGTIHVAPFDERDRELRVTTRGVFGTLYVKCPGGEAGKITDGQRVRITVDLIDDPV